MKLEATARDRLDAYGFEEHEGLYYQLYQDHKDDRDPNGELVYPYDFECVDDIFWQTDPDTEDMAFDYLNTSFGARQDWSTTIQKVNQLNAQAPLNVVYKLLFMARHGQGFHNVAYARYTQDWNYWKVRSTDGDITWGPDAKLTPLGEQQAVANNVSWKQQLESGCPVPTRFYVSPCNRSLATLFGTWNDIEIPQPKVLENLRETMGLHPCNKRSTKYDISCQFPTVVFEDGFPEQDVRHELYPPEERELLHEQFLRVNGALQQIFLDAPQDEIISVTSHAGTIRAAVVVTGHRRFTIPTGGMIPMVIKATKRNIT